MIDYGELRRLARLRLAEARALHASEKFDGAKYLCGYAIECALKARIIRTLRWDAFPHTRREFEDYHSLRTHDLNVLLRLSGVEKRIRHRYLVAWSAVEDWNPEMRYSPVGSAGEAQVREMIEATRVPEGLMIDRKTRLAAAQKLLAIGEEINGERGPLSLYGLFMPEEGPLAYDVVVSAPWVRDGWYDALKYVAEKIQAALQGSEILAVTKVVALKPEEDFVKDVNEQVVVTNGRRELRRCRFGDINFDEVFLTASQSLAEQNGAVREVAVAA